MRLKVKVPLFNTPLVVYVGPPQKQAFLDEIAKTFNLEPNKGPTSGDGHCCGSFIWLARPSVGILAHELHHFADEMTDFLGIKDENREVEAYIVGYCMDMVWPKIKEAK